MSAPTYRLSLYLILKISLVWIPRSSCDEITYDVVRHTFNGCECLKSWEILGAGSCDEKYCCSPDSDPAGDWCMVVDQNCEDADWGYCAVGGVPQVGSSYSDCQDRPGWHDTDGDSCASYSANQWCLRTGQVGPGWHAEEWGDIGSFAASGFSALSACCACGGGQKSGGDSWFSNGAVVSTSSDRYTYNGCQCKSSWEEMGMSCMSGCCNPDNDPSGLWCMVHDSQCEDGEWGYCRPAGSSTPSIQATNRHGHCTDKAGWKDVDNEGCQTYTANAYCTEVGGYGLGWNLEWGAFASFAPDGFTDATDACCACGGGTWDEGTSPWAFITMNLDKVRTTWNDCECKKSWKLDEVGSCDNYCCNPDQDPLGSWCMVVDEKCEESDWGYCQTSGLGTLARPSQEAHACQDIANWHDPDGDDCKMYKQSSWCTAGGATGPGWHEEWGKIEGFSRDGHSGLTACCACGGGKRVEGAADPTAMQSLANLLGEEVQRMWRVTYGPCKMDEQGCITSGNYPSDYSPKEECQISVDTAIAKPIEVKYFDTEFTYDALKVNGEVYSGERGPAGIIPSTTIHWGTDAKYEKKGWMLCPRGEVALRNPVAMLLKAVGVVVLAILMCCCFAVVGLWVRACRLRAAGYDQPTQGAPPEKVGKSSKEEMEA